MRLWSLRRILDAELRNVYVVYGHRHGHRGNLWMTPYLKLPVRPVGDNIKFAAARSKRLLYFKPRVKATSYAMTSWWLWLLGSPQIWGCPLARTTFLLMRDVSPIQSNVLIGCVGWVTPISVAVRLRSLCWGLANTAKPILPSSHHIVYLSMQ